MQRSDHAVTSPYASLIAQLASEGFLRREDAETFDRISRSRWTTLARRRQVAFQLVEKGLRAMRSQLVALGIDVDVIDAQAGQPFEEFVLKMREQAGRIPGHP